MRRYAITAAILLNVQVVVTSVQPAAVQLVAASSVRLKIA